MTAAQLADLGRGHGAPATIALLIDGQLSLRRVALVAVAARAAQLHPDFGSALRLVARIDREAPERGRDLLRHPFLGAWFRSVAPSLATGTAPPRAAGYLGGLAAAVAAEAGIADQLTVQDASWTPDTRIVTHTAGPRHFPAVVTDADPLRDRFGKPVLPALRPGDQVEFMRTLEQAWALLVQEQPEHAAAMRPALRAVVPLRTPADGSQASASARGTFGAVAMSAPGDPVTAAELLVHEFQHEKLNALLDLVPLCAEGGPAVWHAPWRPDPRPASALLQGVYAFAGVTGFWRERRHRTAGSERRLADSRFARSHQQVCYGLDQLSASGELTPAGEIFTAALGATLDAWRQDARRAGQTAKGAMS